MAMVSISTMYRGLAPSYRSWFLHIKNDLGLEEQNMVTNLYRRCIVDWHDRDQLYRQYIVDGQRKS